MLYIYIRNRSAMRNLLWSIFMILSFSVSAQNDVPVNSNFVWNGEISLAANPINPAILVTAWMKMATFTSVSIAISRSTNYGATWSTPVMMPHFSSSFTSADPTLITSSNGTYYFAYIDYDNTTFSAGGVYVTKSTDGLSWTSPVKAIDASFAADVPIDRPWLAIDNSSGPNHGNLYLITKSIKEATMTHHLYFIRSIDDGLSWETPKVLDDVLPVGGTANTMGVPCVSSNGVLYINYLSYDIMQDIHVRDVAMWSNDGGLNFNPMIISELPFASVIPSSDSLFQYSYHIAGNPADANNLIHVFTDRRDGDWDIWYNVSYDAGSTWSQTTRLNDDPVGNGIGQDMVWGGFSPEGIYAALWRDRRDGVPGPTSDYRIYGAASSDKGTTFSPNFALSHTLASLSVPVTGNDFLGVSLSDSLVYGAWADKRTATNQEYFNDHALPGVSGIPTVSKTSPQIIPSVIYNLYVDLDPAFLKEINTFKVSVYDLPGHCILQQSNSCRIDLANIPAGMYILGFFNGNTYIYQRFIKE
jgi:hypothetical protein